MKKYNFLLKAIKLKGVGFQCYYFYTLNQFLINTFRTFQLVLFIIVLIKDCEKLYRNAINCRMCNGKVKYVTEATNLIKDKFKYLNIPISVIFLSEFFF